MKSKSIEKLLGLILVVFVIMACSVFGGAPEEVALIEEPDSSIGEGKEVESNDSEEALGETEPDGNEEVPNTGSGLCENEYYPVVNGGKWSYQGTSSTTEGYSFTNTITSVRDDGFTITVEFDGVTLLQEWTCTPDGILALDSGGGAAGTVNTEAINLVMETQNASGITYPNEILPGDTWDHRLDYTGTMDMAGEAIEVSGDTEYNYTAVGIESITVPAGTFDAMKVDLITTININMTVQGSEVPVTVTSTSTSWFAEGVGWLKSDSVSDIGGVSTTESLELVSYSIP